MSYDAWLDSADPGLYAEESTEPNENDSLLASVPNEQDEAQTPQAWFQDWQEWHAAFVTRCENVERRLDNLRAVATMAPSTNPHLVDALLGADARDLAAQGMQEYKASIAATA